MKRKIIGLLEQLGNMSGRGDFKHSKRIKISPVEVIDNSQNIEDNFL